MRALPTLSLWPNYYRNRSSGVVFSSCKGFGVGDGVGFGFVPVSVFISTTGSRGFESFRFFGVFFFGFFVSSCLSTMTRRCRTLPVCSGIRISSRRSLAALEAQPASPKAKQTMTKTANKR